MGAAVVASAVMLAATPQTDAPRVTILSPAEGEYAIGPTPLRARIESSASPQSVTFFADGRQICVVTRSPYECDWDAGSVVKEHQIRVVAVFAGSARVVQNARTKGLDYVESVDVDVVQVTATVSDGKRYVRGLPKSTFHVFEDGKEQPISHFESENVPLDLLVALDISASMTPAIAKLKQAATTFLEAIPQRDKVTLLAFNDSIFTLARGATDPVERVKAIDRLAPWGATTLYDVIIRGVDLLGRQSGRKAMIVFTDGEDEGSRAPLEEVVRRLEASDVTLYLIGQGRGTEMERLKKIMVQLAQPTGGRALFTEKIDDLRAAFGELLDELANQYLLGYAPPDNRHLDVLHHLKVEVDGHRTVRARQTYRVAPAVKP